MQMSRFELRMWLAGLGWLILDVAAFPADFQDSWLSLLVRFVLCCAIGWNIGGALAAWASPK